MILGEIGWEWRHLIPSDYFSVGPAPSACLESTFFVHSFRKPPFTYLILGLCMLSPRKAELTLVGHGVWFRNWRPIRIEGPFPLFFLSFFWVCCCEQLQIGHRKGFSFVWMPGYFFFAPSLTWISLFSFVSLLPLSKEDNVYLYMRS